MSEPLPPWKTKLTGLEPSFWMVLDGMNFCMLIPFGPQNPWTHEDLSPKNMEIIEFIYLITPKNEDLVLVSNWFLFLERILRSYF